MGCAATAAGPNSVPAARPTAQALGPPEQEAGAVGPGFVEEEREAAGDAAQEGGEVERLGAVDGLAEGEVLPIQVRVVGDDVVDGRAGTRPIRG
jgi:hypothetical protein